MRMIRVPFEVVCPSCNQIHTLCDSTQPMDEVTARCDNCGILMTFKGKVIATEKK